MFQNKRRWEASRVKLGWTVTSIILLALFGATIWLSTGLPILDDLGPGPGFFPLWLAGLGAVLAVLLIMETSRQPAEDGEGLTPDRAALFRIAAIIIVLAAAALAFESLGWRITAFFTVALLLPALGARSIVAIVPFALIASFGVFHVFYHWLKVPLPIGSFGI